MICTMPPEIIRIMFEYLSYDEVPVMTCTSKEWNIISKEEVPLLKDLYYENKIQNIFNNTLLIRTQARVFEKIKPHMNLIRKKYKSWLHSENYIFHAISNSYQDHFVNNNKHFIRMNRDNSFIMYIICTLYH